MLKWISGRIIQRMMYHYQNKLIANDLLLHKMEMEMEMNWMNLYVKRERERGRVGERREMEEYLDMLGKLDMHEMRPICTANNINNQQQ